MATTAANLCQRLVAVRAAIPGIAKDAQTQSAGRFKYVSSNNILSAIRPLMDEQRVLLEVRVTGHNLLDKWRGNDKQNEHLTELEMEFVWVNADNPEERIACSWYGQGLDTGEKGVGKAATYAEKYFLLKFFNIPTDEDDPDGHSRPVPEERNGNKGSSHRLEQPEDIADAAQFNADGTPANAEAELFAKQAAAKPAFPEPEDVVDMGSFAVCMTALGITQPEVVDKAKRAAGLEQFPLDTLDAEALRHIYAVSLEKTLQKRGAA